MDIYEIISVGNELLNGKTLNTNAHWLAKAITELGYFVRRCTVIRDDIEEISSAVRESFERRVDWLIISGGLGPTYDDKTLKGLAKSLDRELVLNEDALRMVKKKYTEIFDHGLLKTVELTPERLKMATLPEGSKPLPNPVGTAPGVLLRKGSMNIICLPGVPSEMKTLFKESIIPIIAKIRKGFYRENNVFITGIVESELAPLIDRVLKSNPLVYIKSHPKGREEGVSKIEIQVTTTAEKPSIALKRIEVALEQLVSLIVEYGGKVDEKSTRSKIEMLKREYPEYPMVGVGALIKQNDSVLLVKRAHKPGKCKWALPGGLLKLGETIKDAVKREVKEEVGLKVELVDLIDVSDYIVFDDENRIRFHYLILNFLANRIDGEIRGSEESSHVNWFKVEELNSLEMTSTTEKLLKDYFMKDQDNR